MPRETGIEVTITTVGNEPARAFVPFPLPPSPALEIDGQLQASLDRALASLGRLDAVSTLLPVRTSFFIQALTKS